MRIHALTLATNDVTNQSRFWGETLGLPTHAHDGHVLEVELRETVIRFEQASSGLDARYHFAINIPRGRIGDAARWLSDRHQLLAFHDDPDVEEGATIVHTDRGAAACYFLDGGGNVVELIANDHLDNSSQQPFGAGSLLEIAEIGIATADTDATRQAVQETLAADVLWGGRPGWQLTAIGDDHGVVIVAPIDRGWIPIGLPARPLPTTIVAAGPTERELVLPEGPYRIRSVAAARMSAADHAPPAPGPYLQTVSGRWVNPFDPDPSQLDAGDIARALANQCRFGGHCRTFYSIAQHSVIVSQLIEQRGGDAHDAFAALMHDATEAYLGDMPHPLKHRSALGAAFKAAEEQLEQVIRRRFAIKPDVPEIKRVDRALLASERRAFSAESWPWPELEGIEPLDLELTAWSPDDAARAFAERYAELDARRAST